MEEVVEEWVEEVLEERMEEVEGTTHGSRVSLSTVEQALVSVRLPWKLCSNTTTSVPPVTARASCRASPLAALPEWTMTTWGTGSGVGGEGRPFPGL